MHSGSPSGPAALAAVQAQDLRPGQHTRGRGFREQGWGASGEGHACAGTAFLAACHKGDPESITTLGKEGTDALVGACSKSPRVHVSRPTHIARCRLVERHLPDPQGQWAACRSTRRKPPYEAHSISSTCIGRRQQTKNQPVLPPKSRLCVHAPGWVASSSARERDPVSWAPKVAPRQRQAGGRAGGCCEAIAARPPVACLASACASLSASAAPRPRHVHL